MDNSRGQFEPIANEKYEAQILEPEPMVFRIGDIIEVRGSRLRVERIKKTRITFKLLPKRNTTTNQNGMTKKRKQRYGKP